MRRAVLAALRSQVTRRRWNGRGAVVVVTGAAGGIGAELSRALAERGATLVLVDRDAGRLAELARTLPGRHRAITCDLLEDEDIGRLATTVADEHGRVDVLVNNTGMTSSARFADRTVGSMVDELMLNTVSPLAVTHALLPLLRSSADPRVVTTVSLAGIWPQAETPLYCASKFGLRGAMLSIGLDLAAHGITVSSVMPSATDTRMLRQEAVDGGNVLQFQHAPQQPAHVVRAVLSLLDRPRPEAYPRRFEALQVRLVMAFPNLVPVLLPLFEGQGRRGLERYLHDLRRRGDVVETDGRLVVT